MATKNIKKILLNKDGDNFVADIENIENRITQNSSNLETAKQELSNKCNEALSEAKAYTDQEKAKYFNSTNGTFTGQEYFRNSDTGVLRFNGGNTHDGGASLQLYAKNPNQDVYKQGVFDLVASTKEDASDAKQFIGMPNGSLTWDGKEIERVNAVGPNYIRYESGLQIETRGYVQRSKKETINFSMPFKDAPAVSITLDGNTADNSAVNFIGYAHPSTTNFISFTNWDGVMVLMYIAIGRWK